MREKRFMTGTTEEFEIFYREYFNRVYKYVYRKIPNPQVAEDITQDTFYAAYVKCQELARHPKPELWLLRTAHNKMLEFYRRMKYRDTVPLEEESLELGKEEIYYQMKELELTALATMNQEEWQLMKKYYFFGYSIQELAEAEGITENNMRVRLSRLKKRLQGDLLQ